jgi:predicted ribosomally synthesized peptide with nif11-like leader
MPIDKSKITKEMLAKAAQCETAEQLIALAKAEGFEITKDEAEAYFAELADVELNEKALRNIAGGTCTLEGTSCWTLST